MHALALAAYLPPALPGIVPNVTPVGAPLMLFSHPAPPCVNRGGERRPPLDPGGGDGGD